MIKKIVHLSIIPLTDSLHSTLLISEFREKDIEVVYLDISNLLEPNKFNKSNPANQFQSMSSLLSYLQKFNKNEVLVNIQLHYEYRFRKFFTEIKNTGVWTSIFCIGFMPTRKSYLRDLLKDILFRPSRYYDLVFYDSESSFQKYKQVNLKILCRNMVIDQWARSPKQIKKTEGSKVAVFLDQFIPFHPDLSFRHISVPSADLYIEKTNITLSSIKKLGYTIKIAKHPRADERVNLFFPDFEVIENCTSDLISSASLVIAHFSTAVGLAILHEKKILILNCGGAQGVELEQLISPFEEQLSQPPIYIGSQITQDDINKITDVKVTPYFRNYLKNNFNNDVFFEELSLAICKLSASSNDATDAT
jgi:hypothetical protein